MQSLFLNKTSDNLRGVGHTAHAVRVICMIRSMLASPLGFKRPNGAITFESVLEGEDKGGFLNLENSLAQ